MISDEEVLKVAKQSATDSVDRGMDSKTGYVYGYLHGFRKCEAMVREKMPSDEQMLKDNKKYVEGNWMKHDPKGSLDHAYYHGQVDLIDRLFGGGK